MSDIREDIHVFARILRLISNYEIGEGEPIDFQVKSTYRFLLQKKQYGRYYQLLALFLKNLHYSKAELKNNFVSLKNALLKLEKDPFEKRAFIYFDIISWLESKSISIEEHANRIE